MTATALPFDDIRALVGQLPGPDEAAAERMKRIFAIAARQGGSLGRLEEIALWLAKWSGRASSVRQPLMAIFAGSHGALPESKGDIAEAVEWCTVGGAAVNGACVAADIGLKVFDLALHVPTGDITKEAALDERGCAATMAFGMEAVAGGTDLLCVSSLGASEPVIAATVLAGLQGGEHPAMQHLEAHHRSIVEQALSCHAGHLKDPLELLRRLGGREFAAIAGAILAARMERTPVILDGPAALAAAAVLHALNADSIAHCLLAQHHDALEFAAAEQRLSLKPLLDLSINNQGTAGALAVSVVKAAAQVATTLSDATPAEDVAPKEGCGGHCGCQ